MSDVTDEDVISSENQLSSEELTTSIVEDTDTDGDDLQQDDSPCLEGPEPPVVTPSKCDGDAEAVTGAQQEEARVDVVFKGTVTLHGCCQFVTEILPVEDIDTEDPDISFQSSILEVTMSDVTIDDDDEEEDVSSENQLSSELNTSIVEDTDTDGDDLQQDDSPRLEGPEPPVVTPSKCDGDTEAVTGAQQEEARVDVVFKGTVTLHGCCQFVTEIVKCVLYQRQQLPMPYEQLKTCQASKQNEEEASCRSVRSADLGWRKRERNLQELDVLLEQLEELFCLSQVPVFFCY